MSIYPNYMVPDLITNHLHNKVYYATTVGIIPKSEMIQTLKTFYLLASVGACYIFICFGYAILFSYVSTHSTVIYQIMLLVAFNVVTLMFKWTFLWLPKNKSSSPVYIFYVEFVSEIIMNFMFPVKYDASMLTLQVISANILFILFIVLELVRLIFSALSLKLVHTIKQRLKGWVRLNKIV